MTPSGYIAMVAFAGQLFVGFLALRRSSASHLALPLGLFSVDLAVWNFASAAVQLSSSPIWGWFDTTATPLTAPFGLWFVLAFVGERKRLRTAHLATWAYFGGLSLLAALGPLSGVSPQLSKTVAAAWPLLLLAGIVPVCGLGMWRLYVHLRASSDADESARTRLLILALPMAAAIGSTEFLRDPLARFGIEVPRLGSVGALFCAILMAIVAFRMRMFGRELSTSVLVFTVGLTVVGVVAYLVLFRLAGTNAALLGVGTAVLTVAIITTMRRAAAAAALRRERVAQLATLGRLSAQMAHDLKNPLAALKGAIQFLQEEHHQGRPIEPHAGFLDLMLRQSDRIGRIVDAYRRLHRLEPEREPLDVAQMVRDTVALQPFAASSGTRIDVVADDDVPRCPLDHDLMSRALENLLRNAFEAMPDGGTITVRIARNERSDAKAAASAGRASSPTPRPSRELVTIDVIDTGHGMDARTRERAFDDFFTTKPTGSGLGLPLVRRIVVAHGGQVSIRPNRPRGTIVRMALPAAGNDAVARPAEQVRASG